MLSEPSNIDAGDALKHCCAEHNNGVLGKNFISKSPGLCTHFRVDMLGQNSQWMKIYKVIFGLNNLHCKL